MSYQTNVMIAIGAMIAFFCVVLGGMLIAANFVEWMKDRKWSSRMAEQGYRVEKIGFFNELFVIGLAALGVGCGIIVCILHVI